MKRSSYLMDMRVARVTRQTITSWRRKLKGDVYACAQCLLPFEPGAWCVARPQRALRVHHTCMAACSVSGGFTAFEMDAVNSYIAKHDPEAVECSVPQGGGN